MRFLFIVFILFFANDLLAQTINLDNYNKRVFSSKFTERDIKIWPSINNYSNKVLIEEGNYVIERKDNQKGKMIFPHWSNPYKNYELRVKLNLRNSDKSQNIIGICFNFSKKHDYGYIIELNAFRKYRIIKTNVNDDVEYLTSGKNNWKKFNYLEKKDEINEIGILVENERIEIYLNDFFAFTFNDEIKSVYKDFGLYIGPSSQGDCSQISLFTNITDYSKYNKLENSQLSRTTDDNSTSSLNLTTTNTKKYREFIMKLRDELIETRKERDEYKLLLDKCNDENTTLIKIATNQTDSKLKETVTTLEKEIAALKKENESLTAEIKSLQHLKVYYIDNDKDKDLLNFLNEELQKAEDKSEQLLRRVQQLENELNNYKEFK